LHPEKLKTKTWSVKKVTVHEITGIERKVHYDFEFNLNNELN
jgi:hypothetical protein